MTPYQWILLSITFTLYLLFGGSVYMMLEQEKEHREIAELAILRKDIQDILLDLDQDFYNESTPSDVIEAIKQAKIGVLSRISAFCNKPNLLEMNSTSSQFHWTFYNSVFFAFTAVTTIGYGNLAPATKWSRLFTIFYALFGIPINGIIITNISDLFKRKIVKIKSRGRATESRLTLAFTIVFYLIPGFLLFIIIPAAFFVLIEDWGFLDSIYFCFVTLTTIGFGDYVAGMGDGHNVWLWCYKVAIIFWIVFGLAYFVMILGFITKGITSDKVRTVLEKKLNRIRVTREKLSKDVEYMRRVVNEMYQSKTKRGFLENIVESNTSIETFIDNLQDLKTYRSKSCNNIFYSSIPTFVDMSLIRSFSESDLDRFNKDTFQFQDEDDPNPTTEDEKFMGNFLSQLVTSLHGDMTDVLEAVEDYDTYEIERNNNEPLGSEDHFQNKSIPDSILDTEKVGRSLCIVNENDEEGLLNGSDENSSLNILAEVVVHTPEITRSGTSGPGTIMDKVTGVFRKISSGTKASSEPPSRKISKNDSWNKLGNAIAAQLQHSSRASSSQSISVATTATCQNSEKDNAGTPATRNLSQISYASDTESNAESVKSMGHKIHKSSVLRNTPLDANALADLLKVLDNVQERISDPNTECSQYSTIGSYNQGFVPSDESTPTEIRRQSKSRHIPRNRKKGIFNPDFKYFSPDLTGIKSGIIDNNNSFNNIYRT